MEKRSQTKVAMAYGAMYGLAAVVVSLVFYLMGTDVENKTSAWLSYLLLLVFIIMGIKSYRDQELGGYISYGQSVGTGVLIGVFGGFITGIYTVILFTVIDPGLAQKIIEAAQQRMAEKGMSEEQMEMAMTWTRKFMSPVILFILSVVGSAFWALLFSAISSLFMRRQQQNPFDTMPKL